MTVDLEALHRELARLAEAPPEEMRKLAHGIAHATPGPPRGARYFTVNLDGPHRIITTAAVQGWNQ